MDVSLLRTARGNAFGKTHEEHPHPNGGHVCQRSSLDGLDWVSNLPLDYTVKVLINFIAQFLASSFVTFVAVDRLHKCSDLWNEIAFIKNKCVMSKD